MAEQSTPASASSAGDPELTPATQADEETPAAAGQEVDQPGDKLDPDAPALDTP